MFKFFLSSLHHSTSSTTDLSVPTSPPLFSSSQILNLSFTHFLSLVFFSCFLHIWHQLSILSPYFLILLQLVPSNLYFSDNDATDEMAGYVQCYRHLQSHEALVSHHLSLVSSHLLSQLQTYCLIKFF